jgi:hypothetical protein
MSIMQYGILKQGIKKSPMHNPGTIISYLQRELRNRLKQSAKSLTELQIAYCCIDHGKPQVRFACKGLPLLLSTRVKRNSPDFNLLHVSENRFLYEIKISSQIPEDQALNFIPEAEDVLYLFTRGIPVNRYDPANDSYQRLAEKLNTYAELSLESQKEKLLKDFMEHSEPQSNICIVGIGF